jgi:hypothetical protein
MVSPGFRKLWINQAADHQRVTVPFFFAFSVLGSVLALHLCPTTELNAAGCRKGSIFHRTLQYDQETGYFCCAKEA